MKIDGSCHCGSVTYNAEVYTDAAVICHCSDCQRMSASPYRVIVPAKESDFFLLGDLPKNYIKVSESGNQRIQAFCSECGTHLYATSIDKVGERVFNLRLGAINQKDKFYPTSQIWCRSAQSWAFNIEKITRLETV